MDIQKKLEDYLNDKDSTEYYPEEDTVLMDKMMEFIMNLDTEKLTDDQVEEMMSIVDDFADEQLDEEMFDEAVTARKVKIKPSDKRKRRQQYRRNRAALKLKAKKFRRTTKYKQWSRMKKRKASQGKTARGKRIRKFM